MRKPLAIGGSILFFLGAPGVVAGLISWLLTGGYDRPRSVLLLLSMAGETRQ